MQVIRMPPQAGEQYPEHDHSEDGQEEVYTALTGSGSIDVEGERVDLEPGVFVRIAAGTKRKVHSGDQGLEMLVIGACPGKSYDIPEMTELEPTAA
jgi:mannose-6-phosphate isomerase-like protein (cupin superfamily)